MLSQSANRGSAAGSRSFTYNRLISSSAKATKWTLALHFFQELHSFSLVDAVSVASTMKACEMSGEWTLALHLLSVLPRNQLDVVALTAAISACTRASAWTSALHIFLDFRNILEVDEILCNAAISACAQGNNWQLAMTLLQQMDFLRLDRSTVTYSSAISAAKTHWILALHLFWTLKTTPSLLPDLVSFAAILSACDGAHWTLALHLLEDMSIISLVPDVVCYTAAINACEKGQQWPLALMMLSHSTTPNVVAYSATISACRKSEQWEWAVHLLHEIHRAMLQANVISYNATIDACQEHWRLSLQLLQSMTMKGLEADLLSFSSAMNGLGSLASFNTWTLALQMIPEEVDPMACNPILCACGRAQAWKSGLWMFHTMDANIASYAAAMQLYGNKLLHHPETLAKMEMETLQLPVLLTGARK